MCTANGVETTRGSSKWDTLVISRWRLVNLSDLWVMAGVAYGLYGIFELFMLFSLERLQRGELNHVDKTS